MKNVTLKVDLTFSDNVKDIEFIRQQVESAIRYHMDTAGIVSERDDAFTENVLVSEISNSTSLDENKIK